MTCVLSLVSKKLVENNSRTIPSPAFLSPTKSFQCYRENNVDELAAEFQFPLVVKANSNALPHKSEAGAVRLGIQSLDELKQAISDISNSVSRFKPGIEIKDFLVETMVGDVIAELLVGINTDNQFGQLLVIASGGVLVELFEDSVTLLLLTSDGIILEVLSTLKCFKLLQGYRGKPSANLNTVVATIRTMADFLRRLITKACWKWISTRRW